MANAVLDNREGTLISHLREHLVDAESLSIVSAYFSVYGYDLLADHLSGVREARFLFGDPSSVDDLTPGEKDEKAFDLTERGLVPQQALKQRPLARRCAEWIRD